MRYKGAKGRAWDSVKRSTRRREKHCYTCNKKNLEGIDSQSGHYRPVAIVGSNNTRSWDERFIHLQCSRCNSPGQGEQVAYRKHLVEDYGEAVVAEFDRLVAAKQVSPVKNWEEVIHRFDSLK